MTDPTRSSAPHAGAPFGAMLRGALLPSVLAGLLTVRRAGRRCAVSTRSPVR